MYIMLTIIIIVNRAVFQAFVDNVRKGDFEYFDKISKKPVVEPFIECALSENHP